MSTGTASKPAMAASAPKQPKQHRYKSLNISRKYCRRWGVWEGVRELVQNWFDGLLLDDLEVEDVLVFEIPRNDACIEFRAYRKSLIPGATRPKKIPALGDALGYILFEPAANGHPSSTRLQNNGVILKESHLRLGGGEKDKRHIGRHGEGMKVGIGALIRDRNSPRSVQYHSDGKLWDFAFRPYDKTGPQAYHELSVSIRKGGAHKTSSSIQAFIKGLAQSELHLDRFLFLRPPLPLEMISSTDPELVRQHGSILNSTGYRGKLFVMGVFVTDLGPKNDDESRRSRLDYGYHLAKMALGRDRGEVIDQAELSRKITRLWKLVLGVPAYCLLYLEMLNTDESKQPRDVLDADRYLQGDDEAARLLFAQLVARHGPTCWFYSPTVGNAAESERIIRTALNREPRLISPLLWRILRAANVVRTPEEGRRRAFEKAAPEEPPSSLFAAHTLHLTRCFCLLSEHTKDVELQFKKCRPGDTIQGMLVRNGDRSIMLLRRETLDPPTVHTDGGRTFCPEYAAASGSGDDAGVAASRLNLTCPCSALHAAALTYDEIAEEKSATGSRDHQYRHQLADWMPRKLDAAVDQASIVLSWFVSARAVEKFALRIWTVGDGPDSSVVEHLFSDRVIANTEVAPSVDDPMAPLAVGPDACIDVGPLSSVPLLLRTVTGTSVTLTGMVPERTYMVQVRAEPASWMPVVFWSLPLTFRGPPKQNAQPEKTKKRKRTASDSQVGSAAKRMAHAGPVCRAADFAESDSDFPDNAKADDDDDDDDDNFDLDDDDYYDDGNTSGDNGDEEYLPQRRAEKHFDAEALSEVTLSDSVTVRPGDFIRYKGNIQKQRRTYYGAVHAIERIKKKTELLVTQFLSFDEFFGLGDGAVGLMLLYEDPDCMGTEEDATWVQASSIHDIALIQTAGNPVSYTRAWGNTQLPSTCSLLCRLAISLSARTTVIPVAGHLARDPEPAALVLAQRVPVVDLFCGGGGSSRGFSDAGFDIALGVDSCEIAHATYTSNFPNSRAHCQPVADFLDDIRDCTVSAPEAPVLLISTPCQGFSSANPGGKDDKKNRAQMRTVKTAASRLKPSLIFFENVPGLLHSRHRGYLDRIVVDLVLEGYSVTFGRCAASDYGVAQKRARVILMAARKGFSLPAWPAPTHLGITTTLRDAIGDLPPNPRSKGNGPCTDRAGAYYASDGKIIANHVTGYKPSGSSGWPVANLDERGDATRTAPGSRWACIHPERQDVLSVREMARSMSFPDAHLFLGTMRAQYRLVGNAVAPLVAKAFAGEFRKCFERHNGIQPGESSSISWGT